MSFAVLAFDLETVPDIDGLRAVHGFAADLPDAEVAEMARRHYRQEKGNDFLPLPLHRIIAISCTLERDDTLQVFSIKAWEDEARALRQFFAGMEKLDRDFRKPPRLVSWNGGGFDLPVMNYRAMKHGVRAQLYWESGERRTDFRYNQTYSHRYNLDRHLDLMDALSMFQFGAAAKLDDVAKVCGLPGKIGIGGDGVWDAFLAGKQEEICHYCECDSMLTYLLYLRFERFRGRLDDDAAAAREEAAAEYMHNVGGHWGRFIDAWRP